MSNEKVEQLKKELAHVQKRLDDAIAENEVNQHPLPWGIRSTNYETEEENTFAPARNTSVVFDANNKKVLSTYELPTYQVLLGIVDKVNPNEKGK